MALRLLTTDLPEVLPADPSDAQLLDMLASLLAVMPGPRLAVRLSLVLEYLCGACCPAGEADAAQRARELARDLAEYLNSRSVLRTADASPAGLDAFAADAPLVFLHAAAIACARCQRMTEGGGSR